MAQLVLGLAGAAVGTFFGVPQLGFALGSALGAGFGPGVKTVGPQLNDLRVTTSSYGTTIPYLIGHPRVPANVIWASDLIKIATTTRSGGKGQPKVTTTTFTYKVNILYLLSINEISDVARIWSNGKLAYPADEPPWDRMTFYDGNSSQMPDPTYEAAVGTDNAPAYRGRCTIFIEGLQCGSSGQIPSPTFEVGSRSELWVSVRELCRRSGLKDNQFDVSGINTSGGYGPYVESLPISQVTTTRTVLELLSTCYFFEAVLSDKIYFRYRARDVATSIPYDDLGITEADGFDPEPFPIRKKSSVERVSQVAFSYANLINDQQNDTQYSDLLLTDQINTSNIQVPIGFQPEQAKVIADAMCFDPAAGSLTATVKVDHSYASIEPSDCVFVYDKEGAGYRMRIVTLTHDNSILTLELLLDDPYVFTPSGLTSSDYEEHTSVPNLPDTITMPLDIPLLRDDDDLIGHYVAIMGSNKEWIDGALYDSYDDTTYVLNTPLITEGPLGTCGTVLGPWSGGNVFDEMNSVEVDTSRLELSSTTHDGIVADSTVNVAVVGNEIIQFRDATLLSPFVYRLTGLLRGRKGTEWATDSHGASERFALLSLNGVRFIPRTNSDLGATLYYKGVTSGRSLSTATAVSMQFLGINKKPWSPVDARANRDTTDTVVTFQRRTRRGTRLIGPLGMSAPLGEDIESYQMDIYSDNTFTVKVRTLTASTPAFTYTASQRAIDATSDTEIYVDIVQMSSIVGRGYPLRAII